MDGFHDEGVRIVNNNGGKPPGIHAGLVTAKLSGLEQIMTLIVFEPVLTGHHETLLRQYLRLFCAMPIRVRLICAKQDLFRGEKWLEDALGEGRFSVAVLPERRLPDHRLPMPIRLLWSSVIDFRYWLELRREILSTRAMRPDSPVGVYFMFLGSKPFFPSAFWNWCVPVPWAALCAQAWRAPRRIRETWIGQLWEWIGTAGPRCTGCRRVFFWCGEPEKFLKANVGPDKMRMVTDSTDVSLPEKVPAWLSVLERSCEGKKVVCLVGAVTPRKGVKTFLAASRMLQDFPVCFVIAGKVDWNLFDEVTTKCLLTAAERGQAGLGNLFVLDQRVEVEADLNWIVNRSALCYLAYVGFDGSSNVLSKAAAFRVPVLVSEGTVMAQACRRYNLGWVVPGEDDEAVTKSVLAAVSEDMDTARDFTGFAALQSEAALDVQLQEMVHLLQQPA